LRSCWSTSWVPGDRLHYVVGGVLLERRHPANKGDGWLLFHIWLQRFAYRQVFSIVLFKTLKRAIDGKPFNWDKLERTAQMSKQTEALTETKARSGLSVATR
jgi:hypothetical protein